MARTIKEHGHPWYIAYDQRLEEIYYNKSLSTNTELKSEVNHCRIYIQDTTSRYKYYTYIRCIHKSLTVFLRDDLTKQYVAYEFETTSICSPDISLQTHKSWVRQTIASMLYRSVIMSMFVPEKEHLRHALLFLFNQKKKSCGKSSFAGRIIMVNKLH